MTYLWDTNTASASMARTPAVVERLRQLAPADDVAAASITCGEVLYGIQRLPGGRRREALTTQARVVLDTNVLISAPGWDGMGWDGPE